MSQSENIAVQQHSERPGFKRAFRRFSRNKLALISLAYVIILMIFAFLAPWLSPYDYDQRNLGAENVTMSFKHWFGTDQLGRDMLARNLFAARNAIVVAFASVVVGLMIGMIFGAIAGYYGGWFDLVISRVVDVMFAFPQFLLLVLMVSVMGRGFMTIFIAIGLTSWAHYARLVRAQVMQAKEAEYVEAAKCLGATDRQIIQRSILPNIAGPLLVELSFGIPMAMLAESSMSLIGLGLRPPMPSWGNLITEGAIQMLGFPHLVLWPAMLFGITLLAFTFIGDGLGEIYAKRR